jgi:hypothetical protein
LSQVARNGVSVEWRPAKQRHAGRAGALVGEITEVYGLKKAGHTSDLMQSAPAEPLRVANNRNDWGAVGRPALNHRSEQGVETFCPLRFQSIPPKVDLCHGISFAHA